MSEKIINVLIVDDNEITADCIEKRIEKANEVFSGKTGYRIRPFYYKATSFEIEKAGKIIEEILLKNDINFLLLDRGFFNLIEAKKSNLDLDDEYLYVKKDDKGVKITEILPMISFKKINKLKGIILYTFDDPSQTSEWYVSPEQIKRQLKDIIGEKINLEDIEVILTNSEIYHLAKINIYEKLGQKANDDYFFQGKKKDFLLYGLFMGEILYHRILILLDKKQKEALKLKSKNTQRNLILIFIIFTALSIGGNAAYSYAHKYFENDLGLLFLTLLFSVFFPSLILMLKPSWVLNIED